MTSRQKALLVAELARAKKAEDMVVLDMRKISNITDYFVIASSSSSRRNQTISDNIEQGLRKEKESLAGIEGYLDASWIVVDAYDVVTHIFNKDLRKFYNLEGIWGDAPKVRLCHKKKKRHSKKTSRKK